MVKQFVNTNTLEVTTNWFACLDVELAAGTNSLALRLTDRAGNLTVTNLSYIFAYPTNAPVVSLVWPQDNALLSGTNFTLRGLISDPTAKVSAQITGGGATNTVEGIVERDGKFWIESLPLAGGTNIVAVNAVNVGTNSTITN